MTQDNIKRKRGRPKKSHNNVLVKNIFTFPMVMPRDYQIPAWRDYHNGCKNIILSFPRRYGKDVTSLSMAIDYAIKNPGSNVALMAPDKAWARRIWFDAGQDYEVVDPITNHKRKLQGTLIQALLPKNLIAKYLETDSKVVLTNGSKIELFGTDEKKFVGMKINFCIISECARHKAEAFALIAPVMVESEGVTIYNGTVEDEDNHLWNMIQNGYNDPETHVTYLTAEDCPQYYWQSPIDTVTGKREFNINGHLVGKINPYTGKKYENIHKLLARGLTKSYLIREFLNIPTSMEENSYYSELLAQANEEGRISDLVTYNPDLHVWTAWDLGVKDNTAIVFYQYDEKTKQIYVIDYFTDSGQDIGYFIDIVRSKPYQYAGHFAPHDANQRNRQTNLNDVDYARTHYDFHFSVIPRAGKVSGEIQIIRSYIKDAHFLRSTTKELIKSLMGYHKNPRTGEPVHDHHSHGSDAFRYMIICINKSLLQPNAMLRPTKPDYRRRGFRHHIDNTPTRLDGEGNISYKPSSNMPANIDDCVGGRTYL